MTALIGQGRVCFPFTARLKMVPTTGPASWIFFTMPLLRASG